MSDKDEDTKVLGRRPEEVGIFRLTSPSSAAEQHIHALATAMDVAVFIHTRDFEVWAASASTAKPQHDRQAKIHVAPLHLAFSELIALHELGHLHLDHDPENGRHGAIGELACERDAWLWAFDQLCSPLTAVERDLVATIMARRAWCSIVCDGHPAPPVDDSIWRLIAAGRELRCDLLGERGEWFREDLQEQGLDIEIGSRALIDWLRTHAVSSAE